MAPPKKPDTGHLLFRAEDKETLAAIDEGMRDAEAGRTVPAKGVRKLVRKWAASRSVPISAEAEVKKQLSRGRKLMAKHRKVFRSLSK